MKNILYIDDEVLYHELIARRLKRYGYVVTATQDGYEGIKLIEENNFDAVLLDMNMPKIDGLSVLKQLRKNHNLMSLPIIMLTAEDDNEMLVSALHFGANDYLVKSVNPEVAAARINIQITLKHYYQEQQNFVRFASHDLQKPILLLKDIACSLLAQTNDIQSVTDDIKLIESTCTNMQEIVFGFLHKGRDSLKRKLTQTININELIREIININQTYAAEKHHQLDFNESDCSCSLSTNAFALRQVLDNLIGNAIKFSPSHCTTRIHCSIENDIATINVKDQGPGLTDDDLKLVFKKQQPLSNKPTGSESSTGVGLYLCYELMQQIQGNMGVYNNEDKGATFWIKVPLNLTFHH